jgi:hypothetical protein
MSRHAHDAEPFPFVVCRRRTDGREDLLPDVLDLSTESLLAGFLAIARKGKEYQDVSRPGRGRCTEGER